MHQKIVDVLIVGAGPTGLTLACELRRRGIQIRLIDQLPARTTQSRALGLQARSLEVSGTNRAWSQASIAGFPSIPCISMKMENRSA